MQPAGPPRDGAGLQSGDETSPLSVLLVEDNLEDARLFEKHLDEYATQTGIEATLRREESLEAGLEVLGTKRPDVVVLDLGLPDSRSVDTIQRATAAAPASVPIVVLTGQDDLEVALSAQQAGAAEYIRKEELTPSLIGRTLRWAAERSRMEARLRQRDAWIRSITESVSGGVFRVGPTGQIEYANDALAGLLGFEEPEQLFGKNLTAFYAEASARGTLLAKEGAETEEVELKRRDGSTFTGLLSAEVARREDGTPIHFDGFITDITERKRAERRLQESRERLANAQRIAGLGSWERRFDEERRVDEDGRLYWSEETRRIFDWDPEEEVTYESFMAAVHPEDREALRAQQERALEEGVSIDIEYRIRRPNGEMRVLKEQGEVEFAEDGSAIRLSGTVLDVTERKEREKRLKVLSEAVQQAKEAVLITEAEPLGEPGPKIVYVNEAFERRTGYSEAEVLWKTPRILQGPETERAVLDSLREALEAGEEWEGETVNYRKDGTPYQVQWNVSPVRGDDGEIEYWVSVQRDVTEERKREQQLRLTAKALEQINEKVFITDQDGQIEYVNDAFEEMTGYSEAEVLGKLPSVLQSGVQEEPFYEELWDSIRGGDTFEAEFVNERKDGTQYVEAERIAPVNGEDGKITHFVSSARDVTEKKKRERRLQEAKEEAEKASRLKSVFLANMSHEIRTPLTSILGFAEAIGEKVGAEEETVVEFARLIEQSGQRLMNTLTSVLNLSKLQAGEMNIGIGPVDLTAEAAETVEEFRPQARKAGIELKGSVDPETGEDGGPVWARADEGGVQIALRNLLSNAIKYTEEGGEVRLRTRVEGEMAAVEVEDTGIGMDPETVSGLFEAFKQASEGIGRKYEGTGLGLTVTKEVLSRMGGRVDVETEKGVGSRFTAWLPRAEEGASS